MEFSRQQLADWIAYERTRRERCFDIYSADARESTGLDLKSYYFVMKHYGALRVAVEADDRELTYAERMARFVPD